MEWKHEVKRRNEKERNREKLNWMKCNKRSQWERGVRSFFLTLFSLCSFVVLHSTSWSGSHSSLLFLLLIYNGMKWSVKWAKDKDKEEKEPELRCQVMKREKTKGKWTKRASFFPYLSSFLLCLSSTAKCSWLSSSHSLGYIINKKSTILSFLSISILKRKNAKKWKQETWTE